MNNNSENSRIMLRGLPSWALSGRKSLWGLAQVLRQVSTIQIDLLLRTRVRGHQFVVSVREIDRFYMQCQIMSYSWITISFFHDKVVVHKVNLVRISHFISWAVVYRVVTTIMFLHKWVGVLVFTFQFQHIARFHYFLTTQLLMS